MTPIIKISAKKRLHKVFIETNIHIINEPNQNTKLQIRVSYISKSYAGMYLLKLL